jgi:hypothetical protein
MAGNLQTDLATVAVSISETFRPLFVRWASDEVREVYGRTMDALWSAASQGGGSDFDSMPRQIEGLPEFEYDDPDHRDFFVMLALLQLHATVSFVRAVAFDERSGDLAEQLEATTDHLIREMHLGSLRTDLFAEIQRPDGPLTTPQAQAIAKRWSVRVDSAITLVARLHGWPPDRLRRP